MIDFKDKVVFLPNEEPGASKIWEYFLANFSSLGIKKLITYGKEFVHIQLSPSKSTSEQLSNKEEYLNQSDIVVAKVNKKDLNKMKAWVGDKDYIFKVGKKHITSFGELDDKQKPKQSKKSQE